MNQSTSAENVQYASSNQQNASHGSGHHNEEGFKSMGRKGQSSHRVDGG